MRILTLLSTAVLLSTPAAVKAVNVIFTLTGTSTATVAGATLNPGANLDGAQQAPGSLGARTVSGTITVNVDNLTAPNSITFVSATLDPANFGTNLQPGIGGTAGSAPAEFGLLFDFTPVGLPASEVVAWRDSVTNTTSGIIPMSGGAFATSGITFAPIAGTIDFGGVAAGTGSLVGLSDVNDSTANGSYSVAGNTVTLTIPNYDYTYTTNFSGTPGSIRFTGTLTATAVIPEPALPALLLAGLAPLALRRRK